VSAWVYPGVIASYNRRDAELITVDPEFVGGVGYIEAVPLFRKLTPPKRG